MEEAQSSYCCVASAYVVLPRAAATVAFAVVVSSSSDRCAFIDDDVFPRLVRHLYNFMCSTRPMQFNNKCLYIIYYITTNTEYCIIFILYVCTYIYFIVYTMIIRYILCKHRYYRVCPHRSHFQKLSI